MSRAAVPAAALVALLVGCAAPPADEPAGPSTNPGHGSVVAAERIPLRVEFEPPLRAPGELRYACESGFAGVVAAAPSGVDLRLPPGPATFVLVADGATREFAVTVVPGMPFVRWRLAPAVRVRTGDGIVDPGVALRQVRR